MLSGELTVTGCDSIKIPLHRHRHPRHIEVRFHGEPPCVPCDHPHRDELEWTCSQRDPDSFHEIDDKYEDDDEREYREPEDRESFHLTIFWDVASVREIKWEVRW